MSVRSVKPPIGLAPNLPRQFYLGGAALARFRGFEPTPGGRFPEEWIASTTPRFGQRRSGLTALPDGALLRDAVAADPVAWLGAAHVDRFGANPALLVKLLDAGERLPVHVHPTRAFAAEHLDSAFGKTEAWVILGTAGDEAVVQLGFARDVGADELAGWIADQDVPAMQGAMNRVAVRAGDSVLVPAGTPHVIGAGVFCLEVQEPTDFSVNLEWASFPEMDRELITLGLAPELAYQCVRRERLSPEYVAGLRRDHAHAAVAGVERLLPPAADAFFRAERLRLTAGAAPLPLDASFAVLVVTDGAGRIEGEGFAPLPLSRGDALLLAHDTGATTLSGELTAIRCLPPAPDAAGGDAR